MTTKRAEELCEGDVIVFKGIHLAVKDVQHPFHDIVRLVIDSRKGRVFVIHIPTSREFSVVTHQLWTALYTHEYGNDSYLFLVESMDDVTVPLNERKVAEMLGLPFDVDTDVVHSARLINHSIANPTDIRDHKGNPLPIYKD
jgi:hypothetical protein